MEKSSDATVSDLNSEREYLAKEARRYASHYPEASDGRNTFVLFAEMIEARITSSSASNVDASQAFAKWLNSGPEVAKAAGIEVEVSAITAQGDTLKLTSSGFPQDVHQSKAVGIGIFRNGKMIGFVPGTSFEDEYKLPEDNDERKLLYTHPAPEADMGVLGYVVLHPDGHVHECEFYAEEGEITLSAWHVNNGYRIEPVGLINPPPQLIVVEVARER